MANATVPAGGPSRLSIPPLPDCSSSFQNLISFAEAHADLLKKAVVCRYLTETARALLLVVDGNQDRGQVERISKTVEGCLLAPFPFPKESLVVSSLPADEIPRATLLRPAAFDRYRPRAYAAMRTDYSRLISVAVALEEVLMHTGSF